MTKPNPIALKAIILIVSVVSLFSCKSFLEDFVFAPTAMFDLKKVGYQQTEYFISGTADSYLPVSELTSDGKWEVVKNQQAEYTTRIIVIRPIDPEKFNGTVVVEWNNVSGNADATPEWSMAHTEFIREGYAWVGVTAQRKGIDNVGPFGLLDGILEASLKTINPVRYKVLSHPGDNFSYSIYTQAAQRVRYAEGKDYLGGLKIEKMIAAGESQSASRMVSYINMLGKDNHLFDGFIVHSRLGSSAPVSGEPLETMQPPDIVRIRDDLDKPVLMLQTETDLFVAFEFFPGTAYESRQPDSDMFRLWEVAGTSHADVYSVLGMFDNGQSDYYATPLKSSHAIPVLIRCSTYINGNPMHHFVVNAAFHAMDHWIRTGYPPSIAGRIDIETDPLRIARDEFGNALGGIRSPYMDVPTATYAPQGQGHILCEISGAMIPFSNEELHSIYHSSEDYLNQVQASTDQAVTDGFLRPADAAKVVSAATSFSRKLR
ncbi:MAG: hypothetical protein KJ737_05075 [Proteobacteria bacterium]|nr:hypothetical protein [Pseudomonadota bacterium]